jgi:hypothetical protein
MRERKKEKVIWYRKERSYSVRRDGTDRRSLTYMRRKTLRSASNTVQRLLDTCQAGSNMLSREERHASVRLRPQREFSPKKRLIFRTVIYGSQQIFPRFMFKQLCLHGNTESSTGVCNFFITGKSQGLISAKHLYPD